MNVYHRKLVILVILFSMMAVGPSFAATITVNTATDELDGGGGGGNCSLREAITNANNGNAGQADCAAGVAGADTITVPAGTYNLTIGASNEDAAAQGDLDITEDVTINGAGAGSTIIDGKANDRVFQILGAFTLDISGMTVRNGKPLAGLVNGGGIHNFGGTLTITNCEISGNTTGGSGGGIDIAGGATTITNSTISGNTAAGDGGGINSNGGTVTVTNSTISGNDADWGGGIHTSAGSTVTVINSTISGNTAVAGNGGGIYINSGTLNLTNTIIANSPVGDDCVNGGGARLIIRRALSWTTSAARQFQAIRTSALSPITVGQRRPTHLTPEASP